MPRATLGWWRLPLLHRAPKPGRLAPAPVLGLTLAVPSSFYGWPQNGVNFRFPNILLFRAMCSVTMAVLESGGTPLLAQQGQ